VDIATEIRAAKDLSETVDCVVRHFAADTGTLHMLEDDGMLHLSQTTKPQWLCDGVVVSVL
jgi:hypothetical protein